MDGKGDGDILPINAFAFYSFCRKLSTAPSRCPLSDAYAIVLRYKFSVLLGNVQAFIEWQNSYSHPILFQECNEFVVD